MQGKIDMLAVGEVLWDVFPEYRRLGGAPFNFALHLRRLGLNCRFISRVGRDAAGAEILQRLHAEGFDPADVQVDEDRHTGVVQVDLDARGAPTFTILEDAAFDRIRFGAAGEALLAGVPEIIYFGTLIQRTRPATAEIQAFLAKRNKASRTLCDINLRPRCTRREAVIASLEQADILKLNEEEFTALKVMLGHGGNDDSFLTALFRDFHLELIALTRGAAGAEIIVTGQRWRGTPPVVGEIADTVGAGDAFSAMLAFGLIRSWDTPRILAAALAFSARICTIRGAVPADRDPYDEMKAWIEETTNE
ncbi:MAG: PfkB family carbohydrate kinase [Acidobacteria bacterium]|nr:PfkB family carbohydrate kinase [Acidobacteriota bacterium]